jgi:hypothetical protein
MRSVENLPDGYSVKLEDGAWRAEFAVDDAVWLGHWRDAAHKATDDAWAHFHRARSVAETQKRIEEIYTPDATKAALGVLLGPAVDRANETIRKRKAKEQARLRDEFAMAALPAFAPAINEFAFHATKTGLPREQIDPSMQGMFDAVAIAAYRLADSMLAARSAPKRDGGL